MARDSAPISTDNLFLIGYRCTGKSSVGRLLAAKLGRSFIDTDSLVVSENGMSIREIVDSLGWEAFRRLEHMALQQVCAADRRVVATGGGIVLDVDNVNLMKRSGRIIWLRASPETIKARMVQDRDSEAFRPALTLTDSISEIEETLAKRASLYKHAMDFLVDTDHERLDAIADFIIEDLKRSDPAIFC
ncbi:MAG: shikimate kinase [Desulfobacterales bacterium]